MMTSSWMEVLSPTPASWLLDERKGVVIWSQMENKLFEKALAHFDKDTGDRWENVADMIPTKTIEDVISHYRDLVEDVSQIEAGLVPFPGYSSSFTLGWEGDGLNRSYGGAKRPGARSSDHERKKGVPWTEEEHRLFLLGLKKYGKGDWRNIARNYVVSRTPTQVASHAQKYFIRLNSGSKDKRRSSIHDITTVNLPDGRSLTASPPSALSVQSRPSPAHPLTGDWFSGSVDSNRDSESNGYGNPFMQPPSYGMDPYGMKSRAQYLHSGALHDPIVEHYGMLF